MWLFETGVKTVADKKDISFSLHKIDLDTNHYRPSAKHR